MQFSKLDDTAFPDLRTASPYALKNTFDYTRWVPDTKIHLVNVLWSSDYSNVVKFENDDARDAWFDGIEDSYVLTLQSNARMVPDGTIKLPLPYDVAACYNYMYVDIPIATSKERMIQNETENGVRRWYFFIGEIAYSAPNTTVLAIQPDIWTNFIDGADINYMMLERGHAPVAMTNTDAYLANPISNNRYLLSPDVNFDDSTIVKTSKFVPFGNGTKYVCFASTASINQMKGGECGTTGSGSAFTKPTYSNTSDWYGYQLKVNGYTFGNGRDYTNLKTPVGYANRQDGMVPNGLQVFAVPASDTMFLQNVRDNAPTFLRTIKALFVVDENMAKIADTFTFLGHTVYTLTGAESNRDFKLDKSMFAFTEEESRFAKLYTYPYSALEISDNNGKTVEVRVENTGRMEIRMLTTVAFPALDCRVFFSGINGIGSQQYQWKNLSGAELEKAVPNGDWDKLCFDLDIPTYTLYMDSETAYMLDAYSSSVSNARVRALTSYHNSVRSANSAYTNAVASADTAHDNSVRQANAVQTNANASATTGRTNLNNVASCNSSNINATISCNTANTTATNHASSVITTENIGRASDVTGYTNAVSHATTVQENETSIATTKNSATAGIWSSAISGFFSGASQGGGFGGGWEAAGNAALGMIGGAITGSISAGAANENASIVAGTNSTITDLNVEANNNTTDRNNECDNNNVITSNENRTQQTSNTNSMLGKQRDNNYSTMTQNATNSYNTSVANAKRTNNAAVSNADDTKATTTKNASRSREIAVLNAKESLETAQAAAQASLYDSRRGTPVELTSAGGSNLPDAFGQKGVQIRARTQSDSAISQTAAQFARFGYSLNQLWDVGKSGLVLMRNFTYWKASDIWIDIRDMATNEVENAINGMFRNGVTVWSNPDMIGKVSIYDN